MGVKGDKRRYYREYRAAGFPFILAQKLAKIRAKGGERYDLPNKGFEIRYVAQCECCGPDITIITWEGKSYVLYDYGMSPVRQR